MAKIAISIDDETLRWLQLEATKAGVTVSQWVGARLSRLGQERTAALRRIEAFLDTGPRFDLSENGNLTIDRDALHDEGRFRRFDAPRTL